MKNSGWHLLQMSPLFQSVRQNINTNNLKTGRIRDIRVGENPIQFCLMCSKVSYELIE